MRIQRLRRAVPFLLLALAGCGDLAALAALQRGIAAEFHAADVSLNIANHARLTIVFVNSPMTAQTPEQRAVTARRVAEYVRDHYARFDSLTTIAVGYSAKQSAGPVAITSTVVPFTFTPAQLRAAPPAATHDSAAARPPTR